LFQRNLTWTEASHIEPEADFKAHAAAEAAVEAEDGTRGQVHGLLTPWSTNKVKKN
jgi:hypothetical protein